MTTHTPAPAHDFVATELRGIIDVCGDSPTAIVSVERMRLWLSKLRAPVADERAALSAVAGLVPPCASRRGNDFREGYLEARVDALRVLRVLASAPVAGEARPVAWLHQCRKKPELTQLSMSKNEPSLAKKGFRPVPLYAAPQASEAQCSCPSGDGSLRHPCAVHPQASEAVPVAWAIFSPSGNIRYWHHDKSNVEAFAAKHGLTVCGLANAGPQSRDAEQIADLVLGHAEGLRVSSLLESGTGFGKDVEHRFQVSNGEDRYGVVMIVTALSAQPGAQKNGGSDGR